MDQTVNILDFKVHAVSVTATQFCSYSTGVAIDNM